MINVEAAGVFGYVAFALCLALLISRTEYPADPQDDTAAPEGPPAAPTEAPAPGESSAAPAPSAPVTCKRMLLITGCSDPSMWYANKVGKHVPYLGVWQNEGYKSREPAGYVNVVKFQDARIVIGENKE